VHQTAANGRKRRLSFAKTTLAALQRLNESLQSALGFVHNINVK